MNELDKSTYRTGVAVLVDVGVFVGLGDGVELGLGVIVGDGLGDGVGVAVLVDVGEGDDVGVLDGVGVHVGPSSSHGSPCATMTADCVGRGVLDANITLSARAGVCVENAVSTMRIKTKKLAIAVTRFMVILLCVSSLPRGREKYTPTVSLLHCLIVADPSTSEESRPGRATIRGVFKASLIKQELI